MRTTVNLDEALLSQAQALCGKQERSALLREALNAKARDGWHAWVETSPN